MGTEVDKTVGRRNVVTVASGVALLLGTTACGQPGVESESLGQGGGRIVVAQQSGAETLDPAMHRNRETQNVIRQIFDVLVDQGPDLEPVPRLATSWTSPSPNEWLLELREDVMFTNGEPFNAEAVKYTFDRIFDPAQESPRGSLMPAYESTEVVDEYSILFRTTVPDAGFITQLAFQEIVPPGYLEEVGDEEFARNPVGTGPFVLDEWIRGQSVTLDANPDYWDGPPLVDGVTFRPIPEVASRVAALQAGEVHIASSLPSDIANTLSGNVQAVSVDGTRIMFLAMNVTTPPFDDKSTRQGVNYALDQTTLAETIFGGNATPLNQPAFPAMDCFDETFEGYTHNPDLARDLLGDVEESIQLDVSTDQRDVAEAVAGQLGAVGLDVAVNSMDQGALTARINDGESAAYLADWGFARGDCNTVYTTHFHSDTREGQFFTGYSTANTDEMIINARELMPDLDAALPVYHELMRTVMEDAPWAPLVAADELYGASLQLEGWEPVPSGRINLAGASLDGS